MLMRWCWMSTLLVITMVQASLAHEVRPAIADVVLTEDQIAIEFRLNAEPLLAGIDLQGLGDTNEAPEAEEYDILRALSPEDLAERVQVEWPDLQSGFLVDANGTAVSLDLDDLEVSDEANIDLPRDTTLLLSGALPPDGSDVRVGWVSKNGPLILRQTSDAEDAYTGFLDGGVMSDPLPRTGTATESSWSVFFRYIAVGFDHIVPKGLDHILFVLGLFFLSLHLRPLITQVTIFTLAHTITLALASLGYVKISPAIVEPLIAASIVYVAVENIFTSRITWWRPIVIFGFGLLHGLGFASVLGEFGLAPGRFVAGLIGFNVGVEIGQLTVIGIALGLLWLAVGAAKLKQLDHLEEMVRDEEVMYQAFSIIGSIIIAVIGAYWVIERTLL